MTGHSSRTRRYAGWGSFAVADVSNERSAPDFSVWAMPRRYPHRSRRARTRVEAARLGSVELVPLSGVAQAVTLNESDDARPQRLRPYVQHGHGPGTCGPEMRMHDAPR